MAQPKLQNRVKSRRKRFFLLRPGFWLAMFLLTLMSAAATWWFLDDYTRPYRDRAATYDLDRINNLEIPSLILDRNGREIGRFFVQNRSIIPIDQVPEKFIQALCAGEDSRFFQHQGVDYIGIGRAAKLTFQGSAQGASTITQQLARNAYDLKSEAVKRGEGTMQRKLVEMFLARRIEQRYTKRQILEFYLNRIYFGSGYYGIRSASLGYFGKEPLDLTTEECASIVTLIKNPVRRSPLNNLEINREGRNYVLSRMREEGMLSPTETANLQAKPLILNPKPLRRGTTHLYERIAEQAGRVMGETTDDESPGASALASGGFKIHTTILSEAQRAAEQALETTLQRAESRPNYQRRKFVEARKDRSDATDCLQGAVLMVDHRTGEVLAHVGGRDYAAVPYDFIELGKRPLGTAFLPFVYAAGMEAGLTPATMLEDEPMDNRAVMVGGREGILGEWGMEVDSPVYQGRITARTALEQSKISATVRFSDQVGLQRIINTANQMGLPLQRAELLRRVAIGFEEVSLKQLMRSMSVFATSGTLPQSELFYIDRIENSSGLTVFRRKRGMEKFTPVLNPAASWQVHSMMAGSLYRGSSRGVLSQLEEKPFHGAGKGGTTHDFSDAWFVGYNRRITCGVWTGFLQSNGGPIYPGAFSRDLAMPVWVATMNAAAPSFGGGSPLTPPASIVETPVCTVSGQRATQFCQEYTQDPTSGVVKTRSCAMNEFFHSGSEKLPFCNVHSGAGSLADHPGSSPTASLPAIDTAPVRPKAAVLLGDDPYHTEMPVFSTTSTQPGLVRRRSNVLDSLDLGTVEENIPLRYPKRLVIDDD